MRWQQTEFLLKGVYLGLLVLVGLQTPTWQEGAQTAAITLGGLLLCLGIAAVQKLREGYRVRGRLIGFILFLILENPVLVYTGLLAGLTLGAYLILNRDMDETLMLAPLLGGAILGQVFWFLRHVRDRRIRLWSALGLAVAIIGGAIAFIEFGPTFTISQRHMLDTVAYLLLLGIPGFYLLTFAGMVEESEIEIAAMCSALGVGMWILAENQSPTFKTLALVLPAVIYFVYTRQILPGLRVFKHVLRGISYAKVGRYRQALVSLGRAIQLDPNNVLARETLWRVHQEIDFTKLINDPETLAVVDFDLCLDRVSWLLLLPKPKPEQIQEAHRLLDLVSSQRPGLMPRCNYWRAVAFTHQGNFDHAAEALHSVLAVPEKDSAQRRSILLPAWQLAILLHPEMKRRVGTPMLATPGGRMEAIAAVERQLANIPDDPGAWDLKRIFYSELSESEYNTRAEPGGAAVDFDHEYVHQLGLALLDDKERWQRGCEYLRIAGRGMSTKAPAFFILMAKAHERAGATQAMWEQYQKAMQAGKAVKPANLTSEDKEALFASVKQLGEHAMAQGKTDEALECFKFYSIYERAGEETWKTLAELFEKKSKEAPELGEDPIWQALHCTLHALTYDPKNKDLLERKDRYYYSISAPELKRRLEHVYKWFDVDYCKTKARWVLEKGGGDLDLLDWAGHLVELASTAEPDSLSARVLRARIQRMRGESDQAIATLEKIRANKPEKFKTTEEEEAWFLTHRMLGEMYVDDKPDQAVMCLLEFRNSPKSGANTMYNLGKAYENLGDKTRALRCYEQVVAFEGNPLVYDAQEAMDRLRGAGSGSFS